MRSATPRTYAAHRRQAHRWASDGATVTTRALRYPRGWPAVPAQEKGVDVALAVDFVKLAIEGEYDVGVMMSTDNDLLPVLEVVRNHDPGRIRVAVWPRGVLQGITSDCGFPVFGATGWTGQTTTRWRIGPGIDAGQRR